MQMQKNLHDNSGDVQQAACYYRKQKIFLK